MVNGHNDQLNVDATAACLVAPEMLLPTPCRASRCAAKDLAARKAALTFSTANVLTCPTRPDGRDGPSWRRAALSGTA